MSSKKPKFKQHASNYNYKTKSKRSFGQKLKNFFTIPEEDFQEEESPKFERVKLFGLNRIRLFTFLALFAIIVNILIIFDLNILYLRQILGFLFIVLVPGLLIMLCFKIRSVGFWEYLVYTIGLSIAFIMFAGLAVNWTLPALNITDKPLSLWPILISFDLFLIILGVVAWKKNEDLNHEFTTPKLDTLNNLFFIIPMIFPLLSILGAFLLNNHGPNILTMIMLGGIAVYVLLLVIFRKKLNENIWPWALWMMALALLLMHSLRSWNILGFDINQEMGVVKLVILNNYWTMNLFQDAYNSCLSLSIFIPVLKIFSNMNINFIFKLIIQIIFSILPIILYFIYKKILRNKAIIFLACFFFISQIFFIEQMPALIRQEIAYLFFSLFFLLIFSSITNYKKLFLLIFGFSVIVSHYSTSYLFLISLLGAYVLACAIKRIPKYNKKEIILAFSLLFLLTLFIFSFLWTSQITKTSSGLINTFRNTFTNAEQIFNQESRSAVIQDLTFKRVDYYNLSREYNKNIDISYQNNSDLNLLESKENPYYIPNKIKEIKNYPFYKTFIYITFVVSSYFKILIIFGIFLSIVFIREFKRKDYIFYSIIFIIITLLIAILPYISFNYNFERVFLQSLIFLSIIVVHSGYKLFKLLSKNENFSIILICIFSILFLLLSSLSVPFVFFGGKGNNILFDNYGMEFNKFYTLNSDIKSLEWIDLYHEKGENFYFDKIVKLKAFSSIPHFKERIFVDISPKTLDKYSYVYSSSYNKKGVLSVIYGGTGFSMNFPTKFLNEKKNKIYNNGGSEIFK